MQKEFYVFRNFNTNVREDLLTDAVVLNIDGPAIVDGERVTNAEVTNPGAKYPRMDIGDTFSTQQSDFFVEDGSYLRLRTLQVGYTFPSDLVPGMRNLRIFVQGENLFTITGYDGLDPSLPALATSSGGFDRRDQARGLDRGTYPSNKTFTFGISALFN